MKERVHRDVVLVFLSALRVNYRVKHATMAISVYGCHSGYVLGSRADLYHLPAHPNVISCYKDNLFLVSLSTLRVNYRVKHATMAISVYGCHSGHVLGSRADLYYLPAHPNVISCCKDNLFDVGCARRVAQMSMRKEAYQKSKTSPVELVYFRFFMIPKELHNMANMLPRFKINLGYHDM